MQEVTPVVFRKFRDDGEIIALFPYDTGNRIGMCSSYMRVGQHGDADYSIVINETHPARPEEYADLKTELENYGPPEAHYNLAILTKWSFKRHCQEFHKEQKRRNRI